MDEGRALEGLTLQQEGWRSDRRKDRPPSLRPLAGPGQSRPQVFCLPEQPLHPLLGSQL